MSDPIAIQSEQALRHAMLLASPEFQKLVQELALTPVRNQIIASEAVLIVGLFLFRTWRIPSIKSFVARIWFQLWTLAAYIAIGGYAIPRYWYGPRLDRLLEMVRPALPPWIVAYWPW